MLTMHTDWYTIIQLCCRTNNKILWSNDFCFKKSNYVIILFLIDMDARVPFTYLSLLAKN